MQWVQTELPKSRFPQGWGDSLCQSLMLLLEQMKLRPWHKKITGFQCWGSKILVWDTYTLTSKLKHLHVYVPTFGSVLGGCRAELPRWCILAQIGQRVCCEMFILLVYRFSTELLQRPPNCPISVLVPFVHKVWNGYFYVSTCDAQLVGKNIISGCVLGPVLGKD